MKKTGKSISQFDHQSSLTGDEWLLVNKDVGDVNFQSKKVKLSTLKDFIVSYIGDSSQETPVPVETGVITATITTNRKTATCSDVVPEDSTVKHSTTSATSGYVDGTQVTLSFNSEATQTKSCWFKITHSGYEDLVYRVDITQTATRTITGSTPVY